MEYLYLVLPFPIAMGAGVAIVLAVIVSSSVSLHWSAAAKLTTILSAMFLGETISGLFSVRLLHNEMEIAQNPWLGYQIIDGVAGGLIKKVAVALMLLVSAGELAAWLLRRTTSRPAVVTLLISFAFYYLAMVWVSAVFGVVRGFSQSWFYAPIVFAAIALLAPEGAVPALRNMRWVLLVGLALNVAPALIEVKRVFELGYASSIIGLPYRLHGVASHANGLGGVALLLLLLELSTLLKERINWVVFAFALAVLILSQSKTTWIAFAICAPLLRLDDLRRVWYRHGAAIVVVVCLLGVAGAVWMSASERPAKFLESLFDVSADEIFTGRVAIWRITWGAFLQNPVFGYGPALWDPVFRAEHNWWVAGHAHNQVLQVLGQAGLFGGIAWLVFVANIGRGVLRSAGAARWLGLALFLALLCRCWSEAPMNMFGISGVDGLGLLFAFAFAAAGFGSPWRVPEPGYRGIA